MLRRPITKAIEEKAENELNETKEIRENSLKQLKEWVNQQQFSSQVTSDLMLLNYLRGCKFDQEKAKAKLSHYFFVKSNKPELLQNRDPASEILQKVMSQGILLLVPAPDIEIILVRWANCTKDSKIVDIMKVALMLFDTYTNESETCMVLSHNVIVDCKDMPFYYLRQFTPSFIKDFTSIILKAYPARIKAIHLLNCSQIVSFLFNIIKSVLPVKIISRIHFYDSNNVDKLHKSIPLSVLPKEYGGEGESVDTIREDTRNILEERRLWFINQDERNVCSKEPI